MQPASRGPQIILGTGILAGIAVLYALILAIALAYLEVFDVRSPAAAAPAYLMAAWPVAAGLVLGWPARHNLGRSHPQQPTTVRLGSLAARPPGRGVGRELGQKLCEVADTQQVALDLTARTPALVPFYTRAGFTCPAPHGLWMLRPPVTPTLDQVRVP
jgi:GNAT superfamily N-acetyltransferase